MIIYSLLATIAALVGWRAYFRQVAKTRAAKADAETAWTESAGSTRAHAAAVDRQRLAELDTEAATSRADAHQAYALGLEVLIKRLAGDAHRSLPAAPWRTADPAVEAKPFVGEFVPPAGPEGLLTIEPTSMPEPTPIKRAAAKKSAAKQ